MNPSTSLRRALRLNAGFSSLSAVTLLVAHTQLGSAMGVDPRLLVLVGVGLLAFAGMLLYTAARSDVPKLRAEALFHSLADFAWVAGSVVVIAGGWLSTIGAGLVAAVALPVLALGIAQYRSLPPKPIEVEQPAAT